MRKAPREVRGAETERIESDQAVHALGWEPVPVPMVVVMVDLVPPPQILFPAWEPEAQDISSAAKHMMNKLAEGIAGVNTESLMAG